MKKVLIDDIWVILPTLVMSPDEQIRLRSKLENVIGEYEIRQVNK
jgi:hypothetical protein